MLSDGDWILLREEAGPWALSSCEQLPTIGGHDRGCHYTSVLWGCCFPAVGLRSPQRQAETRLRHSAGAGTTTEGSECRRTSMFLVCSSSRCSLRTGPETLYLTVLTCQEDSQGRDPVQPLSPAELPS